MKTLIILIALLLASCAGPSLQEQYAEAKACDTDNPDNPEECQSLWDLWNQREERRARKAKEVAAGRCPMGQVLWNVRGVLHCVSQEDTRDKLRELTRRY